MKLMILGIVIILFIGIQFVPYGKDHSNPKSVAEPPWNTKKTRATFFKLCGACHSNETTWPIYSNIAPISWLVHHDVDEGRENLNVSMWDIGIFKKEIKAMRPHMNMKKEICLLGFISYQDHKTNFLKMIKRNS